MHRIRLFVACAVCLAAVRPAAAVNLILNGGFETNGGAGTDIFGNWTVVTEDTSGGGAWWVQNGTNSPVNGFSVPAPPELSTAAMTDDNGPSSNILLQNFTVPAGTSQVVLSFDYFRLIPSSQDYVVPSPETLDYTVNGNEQARADILSSGAGAFDVGATDLLTAFQTNPGDPNQDTGYSTFSLDITSAVSPGGKYQLRFAEVDNLGVLVFGIDHVMVDATTPEPGTFLLLASTLIVLGVMAVRKPAAR